MKRPLSALASALPLLLSPLAAEPPATPPGTAETEAAAAAESLPPVPAVPDELRERFRLADFYQKALVVEDFPIVSSAKVHDAALREAEVIVRGMLGERPELLREMAKNGVRLAVMAVSERTTDIPEHADLEPAAFWNHRARGLGPSPRRPAVSCGEENLLHHRGDPYSTESIMVHEFAHAIHLMGLNTLEPDFDDRLKELYEAALAKGLWEGTYAATNRAEYWAEGVQSWFDTNRANDAIHNHVDTREKLVEYDPALAELLGETFRHTPWRYRRSDLPERADEPHLRDLDRETLPAFRWSPEEVRAARESGGPGGRRRG